MRKTKKVVAFFLSVLMILSICPVAAFAEDNVAITTDGNSGKTVPEVKLSYEIDADENIVMSVALSGAKGLEYITLLMDFDPDVFEYVNFSSDQAFAVGGLSIDDTHTLSAGIWFINYCTDDYLEIGKFILKVLKHQNTVISPSVNEYSGIDMPGIADLAISFSSKPSIDSNPKFTTTELKVENGYVLGLKCGENTAKEFGFLVDNSYFSLTDEQGKELSGSDIIATGAKLNVLDGMNGSVLSTSTIVVKMDVDKNGKITAADARLTLRKSAKLSELDDAQILAADVNGDNTITAADARKILRVSAKLDDVDSPSENTKPDVNKTAAQILTDAVRQNGPIAYEYTDKNINVFIYYDDKTVNTLCFSMDVTLSNGDTVTVIMPYRENQDKQDVYIYEDQISGKEVDVAGTIYKSTYSLTNDAIYSPRFSSNITYSQQANKKDLAEAAVSLMFISIEPLWQAINMDISWQSFGFTAY